MLAGCSDPRTYDVTKLTEDQKNEIGKKLTADEGAKMTGWMIRHAFSGQLPAPGTTVGQAIKEQEEWVSKQKEAKTAEIKKRVDAERKTKQEEFAKLMTIALINKKNVEGRYGQKQVVFEVAYENKGDKDIAGVKGSLKISDMFGDLIVNIVWPHDDEIPAKQIVVGEDGGIDINQFMDNHMKLWNSDYSKLKATFEISTIIFKDGTKIDAPQ